MQLRHRSLHLVSAIAFALGLSVAVSATALFATEKPAVSGELQAWLVTETADGSERLIEASSAEPGQVMEFRIAFTNGGETPVDGIQVVDPIPENTRFIADSHAADVTAAFQVSIDGGDTFESEPVVRVETLADGSQQEVIVPPSQYTHVRWLADEALSARGGRHQFSYRVAVN